MKLGVLSVSFGKTGDEVKCQDENSRQEKKKEDQTVFLTKIGSKFGPHMSFT
jgi:hypothetical protein